MKKAAEIDTGRQVAIKVRRSCSDPDSRRFQELKPRVDSNE